MNKTFKTELYTAIWNPTFCIAILIGIEISMINVVETMQEVYRITTATQEYMIANSIISPSYDGASLFVHWIAVNDVSIGHSVFYFLWPILAAMPFGWSYSWERRSGAIIQLLTRSGVKTYFIAKYIAVFISGGFAVGIPVLLNLLINALVCPSITPNVVNSIVAIFDGQFLSKLFYTYPWFHSLIWCGVDFLLGGAAACLCLVVGSWLRLQVMVVLTPFSLLLILDGVYSVVQRITGWNITLSPFSMASLITGLPNPAWAVFTMIGVIIFFSFGIGWWQVVCHEQI